MTQGGLFLLLGTVMMLVVSPIAGPLPGDLLVMGSHGYGESTGSLLGSIRLRARSARRHIPVLLMRGGNRNTDARGGGPCGSALLSWRWDREHLVRINAKNR